MAPKRKDFNKEDFEKLCYLQCTMNEICFFFDMSDTTLKKRIREHYNMSYLEAFKKYSAGGKLSLRRWQFKAAERGNVSMLIWLGKQYLNQKDKTENNDTLDVSISVERRKHLKKLLKQVWDEERGKDS